jgi:hypothetical protein
MYYFPVFWKSSGCCGKVNTFVTGLQPQARKADGYLLRPALQQGRFKDLRLQALINQEKN